MVALRTPNLVPVQVDADLVVMGMLVDRRDELGRARTQTINRLHRLLLELSAWGLRRRPVQPQIGGGSSASPAPAAWRTVRFASPGSHPVVRSSSLFAVRRSIVTPSPYERTPSAHEVAATRPLSVLIPARTSVPTSGWRR
ncbi:MULTISPECIES: hypothetical protein [Micromonospora]|uniref:hypothetical protein n=1 Tax=Micromonospora TaxID=1873 RepID=UPI00191BD13A|nr:MULTISPECIES: hypothetical protein [unclassified Micromonospora]MBM0229418.1 hypothetical protein [Micromonospora sp. ATA51]